MGVLRFMYVRFTSFRRKLESMGGKAKRVALNFTPRFVNTDWKANFFDSSSRKGMNVL